MRRDYFRLDVRNLEGEPGDVPVVSIDFEGPAEQFEGRLRTETGRFLPGEEIDVAYRLRGRRGD
jgi:hypothetical protein